MQKIYVLLRNDKQTGPYSLEEIIQFDLKPYDLIWIEGKSAGWYYPQEISALHSHLSFLPKQATPVVEKTPQTNTVFVTMPAAAKSEQIPVTEAMQTPMPSFEELTTARVTNASSPLVREEYKSLEPTSKNIEEAVYAQFRKPAKEKETYTTTATTTKPKKKSTVSVGGSIAAVLIVGGVLAASWIMNKRPVETKPATESYSVPSDQIDTAVAKDENTNHKKQSSEPVQKGRKSSATSKQKTIVVKQNSSPQNEPKAVVNNSVDEVSENRDITAPPNEGNTAEAKEETTTLPSEQGAQPEKKKKLRDKILDLFKKSPDEQKPEETKPADTESGERRATRREDGASLAQLVSIRFDVPNDWMMGIKGAKAILVNRSNEVVSKAVVEVLYYDDDNNLLQKKTITFTNVGDKDSKTVSIPDHSTATKVDYNIVSVTGKPGA